MSSQQRRLRIIVAREPEAYAYVRYAFEPLRVDVIIDRRLGGRRRCTEAVATEKRRRERRQRDITDELQRFGWVPVR